MAFNKRLFHLGNQVVSLAKKIDKEFPDPIFGVHDVGKGNIFKEVLTQLLDIINEVRLAVQEDEPKKWIRFNVQCNSQDVHSIKEHIEVRELNYEIHEILDPKSE